MYVVACSSSSSVLAIAGLENSRGPQHFTGLDALNGLELSRVVVSAKTFIHHQRPVGAGGAWGAMASPDFRRSVNPISNWGQIMPTTLIPTTQIFNLPTALLTSTVFGAQNNNHCWPPAAHCIFLFHQNIR